MLSQNKMLWVYPDKFKKILQLNFNTSYNTVHGKAFLFILNVMLLYSQTRQSIFMGHCNPSLIESHRAEKLILQTSYNTGFFMIYQSPKQSLSVWATARGGLTCGLAWHSRKECYSPRKSHYTKVWWISALAKLICGLTYNLL